MDEAESSLITTIWREDTCELEDNAYVLDSATWMNKRDGVTETLLVVINKEFAVPESVLEAIKQGQWDYEPDIVEVEDYDCTPALPGTTEKISILAERAQDGLPLWHPGDRKSFDDSEEALI